MVRIPLTRAGALHPKVQYLPERVADNERLNWRWGKQKNPTRGLEMSKLTGREVRMITFLSKLTMTGECYMGVKD